MYASMKQWEDKLHHMVLLMAIAPLMLLEILAGLPYFLPYSTFLHVFHSVVTHAKGHVFMVYFMHIYTLLS